MFCLLGRSPFIRASAKQRIFRGSEQAPTLLLLPSPTKRPALHSLSTTSCNAEEAGRERSPTEGRGDDNMREEEEESERGT